MKLPQNWKKFLWIPALLVVVCAVVVVAVVVGTAPDDANAPEHQHTEGEWIVDKEATKAEDGSKHQVCAVCGETLKTEVIHATVSVGLAYEVNSDGKTCTVTGIGACTDTDVIIPFTIDGHVVTSIGDDAFYGCSSLTSVTISDSVTSIGKSAFSGCSSLKSVTIPDSVTSIGYSAFSGCSSLASINVDKENTNYLSIDGNLYSKDGTTLIHYAKGKKDASFTILDSVTSIGAYAFFDCSSLTSVTIGNSVTSIGDCAFYICRSLTSVTIPDSVTSIGDYAFLNCSSLTQIHFEGTKAQWNAIIKGIYWNGNTGNYTVHCTDGDIAK